MPPKTKWPQIYKEFARKIRILEAEFLPNLELLSYDQDQYEREYGLFRGLVEAACNHEVSFVKSRLALNSAASKLSHYKPEFNQVIMPHTRSKIKQLRNESSELVESVLEEISKELALSNSVKLSSFGSFSIRQKSERIGRNPKTGVEVPIKPRKVVVFKASHVLKEKINTGQSSYGGETSY